MTLVYAFFSGLNTLRLGVGYVFKVIGILCFFAVFLIIFAMIAAAIIDLSALYYRGSSFGLFSLFLSRAYGDHGSQFDEIVSLIFLIMVAGLASYGIGWVLRIGQNEQDSEGFWGPHHY